MTSRQIKWRIAGGSVLCLCMWAAHSSAQQGLQNVDALTTVASITQVLGSPTDHSIEVSVLAPTETEAYIEYGVKPGAYTGKTAAVKAGAKTPFDITVDKLAANTHYYYRLQYRQPGTANYTAAKEYGFQTQRPPGSTFVFDVEADSHPERVNNMFNASLYERTMANVRKDQPDFFVMLGDDYSIDRLQGTVTPERVAQVYINQRTFLGVDGASTPIFHVNGGHEQGGRYLLDGTPNNPAIWAGNSRNRYLALPVPNGFYTGDNEKVEYIGNLRDYYAWTWGDALFITIDPYWHSKVPVDTVMLTGPRTDDNGKGKRDMWDVTHGEEQYRWLQKTLSESKAKYKFIFAHHVLGTGRGAVEMADGYEWGGKSGNGVWEFDKKRPGWELPIHQLMAKYNVSIFFQGHDHIFVRQQKDGVTYQETPNPANPNYEDENGFHGSYKSGDYLPASGHLRVTVSPEAAKVDYVRSWMAKDETADRKQGAVAFSYSVKPGSNK